MIEIEEQHPIPQQISSYQFRLVGDMTLKQFFQVAIGSVVSLVIYSTNLAGPLKWFLIIIAFLTGIAFAFFPLQDRPLSKWISLFIQAIYSPTIFLWKKNYVKPDYYAPEPSEGTNTIPLPAIPEDQKETTGVSQKEEPPLPPSETEKLEKSEKEFLDKVTKHFENKENPIIKTEPVGVQPIAGITFNKGNQSQRDSNIKIPSKGTVRVDQQKEVGVAERSGFNKNVTPAKPMPSITSAKLQNAQAAQFSPEAAPPEIPEAPNLIVGQTMTTSGSIVENAILEIRDSEGRPVRALKSNRLGHFRIVTPLPNGKYQIIIEKEGLSFVPLNINLTGKIIEPIIIKSQSLQVQKEESNLHDMNLHNKSI